MRIGRFLAVLGVLSLVVAGCSSSGGAASPTTRSSSGTVIQPTAAVEPVTTDDDGGVIASGIPPTIDGQWNTGSAHVDITGGRTVSFDPVGGAFSTGGTAIVTLTDAARGYNLQFTLSNTKPSGLAITGPGLITGGAWGEECQVNVTRNEPGEVAGDFSCADIEAADATANQAFRVDVKGRFSIKP